MGSPTILTTCSHRIEVKESPGRGRGVFAKEPFQPGELIESVPVILAEYCDDLLDKFVYVWGKHLAIALGYGSLYNHSDRPNAEYVAERDAGRVTYWASRPILAGEEIFIDYQWDEADYKGFQT